MLDERIILPNKNETLVVPSINPKSAALVYDRVWLLPHDPEHISCPKEFILYGGTPIELAMDYLLPNMREDKHGCERCKLEFIKKIMVEPQLVKRFKRFSGYDPHNVDNTVVKSYFEYLVTIADIVGDYASLNIARELSNKYNLAVNAMYCSAKSEKLLYSEGKYEFITMTLSNLKIVSEKDLTWEQVREFRKDINARKNFKRLLLHWLDSEMIGKSANFIQDELAIRLQKYEAALKKHGLKTIAGAVKGVFDYKTMIGASIAAQTGFLDTFAGAMTGLAILSARAATAMLNREEVNSEVTWIYELKKAQK